MKGLITTLVLACSVAQADEPVLSPKAPRDRPVRSRSDDKRQRFDAAIAPYVAEARKTYPAARGRYLAGLPTGQHFFVTVRLYEDQRFEQVFLAVQRIDGTHVTGTISNELSALKKRRRGDSVTVDEASILDWLITKPDGSEEGNLVGKFIDSQH